VIRRGLIKGKLKKLFKEQPVVDLVFQFGIEVDAEPLFELQAF
jgi:hypothetical protein